MHFFVVFKKLCVILRLHGQIFTPALLYYTPSMALCGICIGYTDVGKGREQER
jgi:hypothetical protein